METITYSQVQDLVLQLPSQRLPAAYEMLRGLTGTSDQPHSGSDFLRLPLAQRHEILARQAEDLKSYYEQNSTERAAWQAGDFTDESPAG